MRYPLARFRADDEIKASVADCLASGFLSFRGGRVESLEAEFAHLHKADYAVACDHGSSALTLALRAVGVLPGNCVIIPDLAYVAVRNAVLDCGAKPIIVDVDPDTWNLDAKEVRAAIHNYPRAIIAVDTLGVPCDMEAIGMAAGQTPIIQDCCESLGVPHIGLDAGVACFSFFGNKVITAGEGGMLTTCNAVYAGRARRFRNQDPAVDHPYFHRTPAWNFRMTDLQASALRPQLKRLAEMHRARCTVGDFYRHWLPLPRQVAPDWAAHWVVGVFVADPADTSTMLAAHGVESKPMFQPLSTMPGSPDPQRAEANPVSKRIAAHGLMLPCLPDMTERDVRFICRLLKGRAP